MDATCSQCRASFWFDEAYYSSWSLAAPKRCRSCRDARRSLRTQRVGRVGSTGARFMFVRDDQGRDYYASPVAGARVGDRVSFEAADEPEPGYKRPAAYYVEPLP
jgi:hypothetical protein